MADVGEYPVTPDLIAGDVLLYRGTGIFSILIGFWTWHWRCSHVEVFIGDGHSVAARDGQGVGRYPLRMKGLQYVLSPRAPLDLDAALFWFERDAKGRRYGWLDLLAFFGIPINADGLVCSPFAAKFLREGGLAIFNHEHINTIAPFTFLLSELLERVWDAKKEKK